MDITTTNINLRRPPWSTIIALVVLLLQVLSSSSSRPESEILLRFKESLISDKGSVLPSWTSTTQPCSGDVENWVGVHCEHGSVWGLKLENMGLSGVINLDALKELPVLRSLSLANNNFDGAFPSLNKLGALKTVYLSDNKFSGEINSGAFDGMHSLKKVYLANNRFTGPIPSSLASVPKLVELSLEGNRFRGQIPDFHADTMKVFNVSNNELEGQIPAGFSKMNASSFSGNANLCGPPLKPCPSPSKKPSALIISIVLVVAALVAVASLVTVVLQRRSEKSQAMEAAPVPPNERQKKATSSSEELDEMEQGSAHSTGSKKGDGTKLSFLMDDREKFDLADLLKASAEVLGSGYFGASYRAAISNGRIMVVKRFRHLNNVGKEEFQEHMRRLGRLRHPNLLPIVAFYYRKDEKLLVTDFVDNVNLSVHLHGGNGTSGKRNLGWPARLKIVKGIAKGLSYLYNELPSLTLPHGHLKSSNVLLNESLEPILTDYGLVPVVNREHAKEVLVAYNSPEYIQHQRVSKKTDIWSFGMLILEILTGKEVGADLVNWVESLAGQERVGEVFDKELLLSMGETRDGGAYRDGEMVKLLRIGLACAEPDVEKRCDLKEAVEKIQELEDI